MANAARVFDWAQTDTPYRSVRHALRSAFACEARAVLARPAGYDAGARASRRDAGAGDLSPFERAAQAATVIGLLFENCRLDVVRAVSALYMPLEAGGGRGRLIAKADAIHGLAWHVAGYPHLSGYPWAYLRDLVCFWADAPMAQSEPEWLAELGKSSRMLRYIKFGNRERGRPGVCPLLDDLLAEAGAVLEDVFAGRGLIPAPPRAG